MAYTERGILRVLRDELGSMRQEISAVKTTVGQQVQALGALTAKVGELGQSLGIEPQFGLRYASFPTESPELLPNCTPRALAVSEILARLAEKGVVALFGEPGSGKTQLLRLSTAKLSQQWFWLTILRDASEVQASRPPRSGLPSTRRVSRPLISWELRWLFWMIGLALSQGGNSPGRSSGTSARGFLRQRGCASVLPRRAAKLNLHAASYLCRGVGRDRSRRPMDFASGQLCPRVPRRAGRCAAIYFEGSSG
jgi:hypothetical protein